MCATDVNVQILGKFDHCVSYSWIKEVACCSLSAACGGDDRGGLNVVIADDDLVRDLNNQYRGLNENTDVLAFSFTNSGKYYGEGPIQHGSVGSVDFVLPPGRKVSLGEVVISYPQAKRQSDKSDHGVKEELVILMIHGILHLIGHDHEDPEETTVMKRLEAQVLSQIWNEKLV